MVWWMAVLSSCDGFLLFHCCCFFMFFFFFSSRRRHTRLTCDWSSDVCSSDLYLMVSSPTLPLSKVNEYADTTLAQRLSTISGVAQVLVTGEQKYAVRVQVEIGRASCRERV